MRPTSRRPTTLRPTTRRLARSVHALVALLAAATLVGGCTSASETLRPEASSTTTVATGTIVGKVYADPSCPVASLDRPCRVMPVPGAIVEIRRGSATLASSVADRRGRFRLESPTGRVVVVAQTGWEIGTESKTLVDVRPGQTVEVEIGLDTGLR